MKIFGFRAPPTAKSWRSLIPALAQLSVTTIAAVCLGALSCCSQATSQTVSTNKPGAAATNSTMDKFQKPAAAELKKKLNPMQFEVTQHAATEPPFKNEFWENHKPGIYVDIVSGQPLFSSLDKFDSAVVGRASANRWAIKKLSNAPIALYSWTGPKCVRKRPTHTSGMCSTMDRPQPACATASIRRHSGSFQSKRWTRPAMANISSRSSKQGSTNARTKLPQVPRKSDLRNSRRGFDALAPAPRIYEYCSRPNSRETGIREAVY